MYRLGKNEKKKNMNGYKEQLYLFFSSSSFLNFSLISFCSFIPTLTPGDALSEILLVLCLLCRLGVGEGLLRRLGVGERLFRCREDIERLCLLLCNKIEYLNIKLRY